MSQIHQNIAYLRKQKNLDTAAFAALCTIEEKTLLQIEHGSQDPNCDELVRISEALQLPVDRLLKEDFSIFEDRLNTFNLKFLALDVDGVLTDGGMYYTQKGDEFKKFNAKDGLAIKTLTAAGITVGFISSGINGHIIKERAKLLGVQYVYIGTWKKLEVLQEWCSELNIGLQDVAYIGDDVNDLPALTKAGLSACPADAVLKVRQVAHIILNLKGGEGCVREFVERFIRPIE